MSGQEVPLEIPVRDSQLINMPPKAGEKALYRKMISQRPPEPCHVPWPGLCYGRGTQEGHLAALSLLLCL